MLVTNFLKCVFKDIFAYIIRTYNLSKLSAINGTCRFARSCTVNYCEFEKYVVLFDNTKLYYSKVGAYSYVQTGSRIFNSEIGRFCSIAASVSIGPGIHEIDKVSTHPAFYSPSSPLPKVFTKKTHHKTFRKVHIGNDVWIGEKAIVLDGVKVGNGAIIASGAVVVKDVDPYSVVGGVPAKHIKYRFNESIIKILQESKWWDFTDDWFEKNSELMLDVNGFKEYIKCLQKD